MVDPGDVAGRAALPVSTYRQIAADISRRILAGEWPIGGRVPTAKAFAHYYGVHLNTAEKALMLLKEHGWLIGRAGSGRYVSGGRGGAASLASPAA